MVLHKEAMTLFHWAESRLLSIWAELIKGQDNIQADWLSCLEVHPGGWALHRGVFLKITHYFGSPEVDLFASHENHQAPCFFARYFHPQAEAMDADVRLAPRPSPFATQINKEDYTAESQDGIGGPLVASQTVVPNASPPSKREPSSSTSITQHASPGARVPSTLSTATSDFLAIERRQLSDLGLSRDVAATLLASRQDSTVQIYNRTLKVFFAWCSCRKLDPLLTSHETVLDFLQDGLN